ncbi:hypothetical protein RB195_003692 [Necator americanus]|uniref:Major facilitator superfamily (MFS) profile domain-containing protein n=1 Tax=Necator americanus TaxID=51031 RepID=A0ABR1DQ96_NECAM
MSNDNDYRSVPAEERKEEKDAAVIPVKTVDDFLKMGNYCYLILLISEFVLLSGAGNMLYMIFASSAPRVSCRGSNFTIEDVCKKHINISALTDCDLHVQYEFKSLNVEFGYLCSEGRWVKSSISVQMIGVLLGTLFFGTTSDRYGRKSSLVVSFIMTALLSIAVSFSTNLFNFTVIRTILGFFNGGLLGTYGVYKLEHVPKKHRFWVATVIAWAPNFILLNVIAYIAHDWRTFQRVLVLIGSPALILFFFVHESPRWLIQKGKIEEARKVLQRIQHLDRAEETKKDEMEKMLDIAYQKIQARQEKAKNYNIRHLFYTKDMAIATITYCTGIFMTSMINYGLIFNIEMLSGSFFINSILMGSIRWSINIVFGVLDYKWKAMGRKAVHFVSQTSIALCLLAISVTYISGLDDRYAVVIRVSTIIAAATTAQIFITKSISGMEYYPTVVRNSGMAFKSTCSRLGTILAPQLFLVNAWQSLPYVVLTVMATLDTIAFQLVIPETKGKPLPENMPEKRKRSKAMAKRQNSFVNAKV